MPSATVASNLYSDTGVAATVPCVRCVSGFKEGEYRVGGKYGCIFYDLDQAPESVKNDYSVEVTPGQTVKYAVCNRCLLLGQKCFSFPAEHQKEASTAGALVALIGAYNEQTKHRRLRPGEEGWKCPPNASAERQKEAADKDWPMATVEEAREEDFNLRVPTAQEFASAVATIPNVARSLESKLGKKYKPYNDHLVLHNGEIEEDISTESMLSLDAVSRSKAAQLAREEAKKRLFERDVASNMQEMEESPNKRRQPKFNAKKETESRNSKVQTQLNAATIKLASIQEEWDATPSRVRGNMTKKLNAQKKIVEDLKAQLK